MKKMSETRWTGMVLLAAIMMIATDYSSRPHGRDCGMHKEYLRQIYHPADQPLTKKEVITHEKSFNFLFDCGNGYDDFRESFVCWSRQSGPTSKSTTLSSNRGYARLSVGR